MGLSRSFATLPRNALSVFVAKFLIAIAVTVFGLYLLYRILDAALVYYQRELAPKTATKVDDVLVPAFRKVGLVIIYAVGIILTLRNLGWDPTLVFAGAGIAGIVIAFAAQDTFSNLFSGIFLMLDRPFVEGDVILIETGEVARVESIGLRTTQLYEYDHHHVITVPNNQLATRRIVNYSAPDTLFRVDIFVGVAYEADLVKVEQILLAAALDEPEVIRAQGWEPTAQLREFAESSVTMMLRVTLKDPRDRNREPSKLRYDIKRRLDAAGIEIPFPQRVVHMRSDRNGAL
jgi:MscS family membrane protein